MKKIENLIIVSLIVIIIAYAYTNKTLSAINMEEKDYSKTFSSTELVVGKDIEQGFYDLVVDDDSQVIHNGKLVYTKTTINVPLNKGDHLVIEGQVEIKGISNEVVDTTNITNSGYYLISEFSSEDYSNYFLSFQGCTGEIILFSSYQEMFYSDITILVTDFMPIYYSSDENIIFINIPSECSVKIEEV